MLASVLRRLIGRIVAVIGGDDGEVAVVEQWLKVRQPPVEDLERRRLTGDDAAVAVEAVGVGEEELAVAEIGQLGKECVGLKRFRLIGLAVPAG
jgi:hypothetical protein